MRKVDLVDAGSMTATCAECGRVFDMFIELDVEEWRYGHDCEVA